MNDTSRAAIKRARAIIAELDRRYRITQDALFIDLLQCGIEYAAAEYLEAQEQNSKPE